MSTRIPLELSSTLDATQQATLLLGASAEVSPYTNETGTAAKAPVLVSIAANRTVDADEFAKLMLENGNQGTLPQARLVVNAVAAVLTRLAEEYGAVTVQTPFGTVQTFVAGSVENPQDAADADANYAWLGVALPESFRRTVAAIETYVPSGACPAALKRIRDKATNAPHIADTGEFYLEGLGLTFGRSDETLELLDADGEAKVCDVAVAPDPAPSEVQFVCNLPRAVAAGRYTLRLVTSAGGEKLWPLTIKADVESAIVPAVKSIVSEAAGAAAGVLVRNAAIKVSGANFGADADGVAVKFVYADGTEVAGTVSAASDSLVTVAWPAAFDGVADGTELTLTVTRTVDGEDYASPASKAVVG